MDSSSHIIYFGRYILIILSTCRSFFPKKIKFLHQLIISTSSLIVLGVRIRIIKVSTFPKRRFSVNGGKRILIILD